MKNKLYSIVALILVVGLLASMCLPIFATVITSRGRGIIDDTAYYIVNTSSGYLEYLAPDGANVGYVGSTCVFQNPDLSDSKYAWKVDKQSDGTFKIRAFGGNTNANYLYAASYMNAIVNYDTIESAVKFDIIRIDSGINEGKYAIMNNGNYVTLDASNLELYSEAQSGSYWSFIAVDKGIADFYSYNYGDFNSTNISAEILSSYDSWGYWDSYFLENHVPASDILWFMTENDVSIYAGLGEAGALIVDPNASSGGKIVAHTALDEDAAHSYINTLSTNALARSRCIIYLSSQSGTTVLDEEGHSHNLVDETYNKGAHCVIGFTVDVGSNLCHNWINKFVEKINQGSSINEAINHANSVFIDNPWSDSVYYRGDVTQKLKF